MLTEIEKMTADDCRERIDEIELELDAMGSRDVDPCDKTDRQNLEHELRNLNALLPKLEVEEEKQNQMDAIDSIFDLVDEMDEEERKRDEEWMKEMDQEAEEARMGRPMNHEENCVYWGLRPDDPILIGSMDDEGEV